MDVTVEIAVRLLGIPNPDNCPDVAPGKPREPQMSDISDFFGFSARGQDVGGFPEHLKLNERSPENSHAAKMIMR